MTTITVNSQQVREAQKNMRELRGELNNLAGDIPGLGGAMSGLNSIATLFTSGMGAGIGAVAGLGIAAGVTVVALTALGAVMAFSYASKLDDLADLGAKLGVSADNAYYLKTAMEASGFSIDTLSGAQERLAKAMMKSGDDTKGAGEAFNRLGVETQSADGKLRSTEAVLGDLAKKFKDGKDQMDLSKLTTQEMADLQLTLGKNYREVILAEQARQEAEKVSMEMAQAGIGVSKEAVELAGEQEKGQMKMGAIMNQVGGIMVEIVLPAFNELVNWFIKSYKEGGAVATAFNVIAATTKVVITVIRTVIENISILIDAFSLLGRTGISNIGGIWKILKGDLSGGFAQIEASVKGLGEGLLNLGKRYKDNAIKGITEVVEAVTTDAVGSAQAKIKATGATGKIDIPGGGLAGGRPTPAKEKKEQKDPIESLISSLEKQIRTTEGLNLVEQINLELQDKKYAKSDRGLKQKAQELAQQAMVANANKSVDAITEGLEKQTRSQEGLNAVQRIEIELQDKKNAAATDEVKNRARAAAATKDESDRKKFLLGIDENLSNMTQDIVNGLEDEIRARTMSDREMRQHTDLRKVDLQIQKDINKAKKDGILTSEMEAAMIERGNKAKSDIIAANTAAKASSDNFFVNGINSYIKNLGTWQDEATKLTEKGIKGIEQGLTALITGGEFSWKGFVKSIIDGLIQMMVQFMIMKPILEWFKTSMSTMGGGGGMVGTAASFIGSLFAAQGTFTDHHASGGIKSSATTGFFGGMPTTMGEAGDEAIMPLKRNAAGDLGVIVASGSQGQASMHQTNHITVTNSGGGSDEDNKKTAMVISQMIDKKWNENFTKAYRPGGMANRATLTV